MTDIFKDLKVLELASVLAGPSVGQFFAELGADVIKVENPGTGGDVTRTWKGDGEISDDRSAYFCSVNWGKKSVSADLNTPEGKDIVANLVGTCDVVIASYKPGDAEKLGVDYKTLSNLNPRLVYGMITGYGSNNPRVGYDAVIQAEAGFMSMNGEAGGASLKMPVALVDILAGHQLKEGILIALLNRERTGKGDCIEVSLIQSAVASLANQGTNWLVAGKLPTKKGSAHPNIAPYGDVFTTSDKKEILLAVGNDKQFQQLCSIVGVSNLASDNRFRENASRVVNRPELNKLLQNAFQYFEAATLLSKFDQSKIPAGVIQNLREVFQMPEVAPLMLGDEALKGVRTYVGRHANVNIAKELSAPPHLAR